jgi:hypothetical protein
MHAMCSKFCYDESNKEAISNLGGETPLERSRLKLMISSLKSIVFEALPNFQETQQMSYIG